MISLFRRLFAGAEPMIAQARPSDASALAALHASAFRRGWTEEEFERRGGPMAERKETKLLHRGNWYA